MSPSQLSVARRQKAAGGTESANSSYAFLNGSSSILIGMLSNFLLRSGGDMGRFELACDPILVREGVLPERGCPDGSMPMAHRESPELSIALTAPAYGRLN
jgi:hypothetical protein